MVAYRHLAAVGTFCEATAPLRSGCAASLATLILLACYATPASGETSISVLQRPPDNARNSHYLTNRPPLKAGALVKLPIGSVTPRGWLAETLRRQQKGLAGRLPEVSAWLQKEGNAWRAADGRGKWGWEEVPYWLRGAVLLSQLVDDRELISESEDWIDAVLASQRPNGQFGPLRVFGDDDSPDLWANMLMLACLQSYYEYSHDELVLDLMRDYFRYLTTVPDGKMFTHFWQYYRGGDNLVSVYWLYNQTGEAWLLDLAKKVHRNTADWRKEGDLPNWHGVNIAQAFGKPATYYLQSREPSDLEAAYRNLRLVQQRYGQFPGGMFAADENARVGYSDPRQAIETCAVVEQIRSDQQLLAVTGDPFWADHIEDVAFNTYPSTIAPNYRALRYLTSPNLVSSDSGNHAPGVENSGPMFTFNPLSHRCCQHNHTQGWPRFVEHLWMATNDNGLCAAYYGPSMVEAVVADAVPVRIVETTRYPFEEQVALEITPETTTTFPLYLRVPSWSERSIVLVNGTEVAENVSPSTYVKILRAWAPGDKVVIRLPMDIAVRRWRANHNSVSVDRGPLTYSLKIGSKQLEVDPIRTVAIDSQWRDDIDRDAWPAHELQPTTPWNYGLVLDGQPLDQNFEVHQRDWPEDGYPFSPESVPIVIKCRGKRIPEWTRDLTGLCGRLQPSPAYTEMPTEPILLIPMGAAPLRISAFPEANSDRDVPAWQAVSNAIQDFKPSASYCAQDDSVSAIADGLLPCASSDQSIPRHTFSPRVGTREWLQAEFEEPRQVSRVGVYWCDDTSRYDHAPTGPFGRAIKETDCRAPKSWHLLYQIDGDWRPVPLAQGFGVKVNRLNTVSFPAIETKSLRLVVQLAGGASAGVLEWEVSDPPSDFDTSTKIPGLPSSPLSRAKVDRIHSTIQPHLRTDIQGFP